MYNAVLILTFVSPAIWPLMYSREVLWVFLGIRELSFLPSSEYVSQVSAPVLGAVETLGLHNSVKRMAETMPDLPDLSQASKNKQNHSAQCMSTSDRTPLSL